MTLDRFRVLHEKFIAEKAISDSLPRNPISPEEEWKFKENAKTFDQRFGAASVPCRHSSRTDFLGTQWIHTLELLNPKLGTGCLLALIGDRGNGKTQMAVELIRQACKNGGSGRYVTAMDVFLEIKATYRDKAEESERDVINRFASPGILVIDEIHERGETEWEDRLLTHIIDKRYQNERDTLVIANLKESEFTKSMGPSIVSRLIETGGIVHCEWPSYRKP